MKYADAELIAETVWDVVRANIRDSIATSLLRILEENITDLEYEGLIDAK
jgi:hypothetical protein